MLRFILNSSLLLLTVTFTSCSVNAQEEGNLSLAPGVKVVVADPALAPLIEVVAKDYFLVSGLDTTSVAGPKVELALSLDPEKTAEAYTLVVSATGVAISGGTYGAVTMGLTDLWHSLDEEQNVPFSNYSDQPAYPYRSVMLDNGRAWHEPETVREAIDLCRWYKLNYLHLHLTDDSGFAFPSTAFPELATKGMSYSQEELAALNSYAWERGVTLVPELDVPGHSSQFIKKLPEVFGIGTATNNPYTVSMGREDTYQALDVLIGELAEAFPHSPYIHIGGDEAFFEGMENDPATVAYMEAHDLPNLHELFRHFLIRMNNSVRKRGRQTIVWAGFGEHGDLEIPKNMIVMLWELIYHHPNELLESGYSIINASFKPLYVVNNRKWPGQYIFEQWSPNRWESWANVGDGFLGVELPDNDQVLGSTMCAWEQHQTNQVPRLRSRVPAMAARLWNKKDERPWSVVKDVFSRADAQFSSFTRPFTVSMKGLTYPEEKEGNFYDHRWFASEVELDIDQIGGGFQIMFTTADDPADEDWRPWQGALSIRKSMHLRIKAMDRYGDQLGRQYYQRFFLRPVKAQVAGLLEDLPPGSWEKLRFQDRAEVRFSEVNSDYTLHYTIDGTQVTATSPAYAGPFEITETTTLRAALFDEKGMTHGASFVETYYKVWPRPSLTTNKRTWSSGEALRPGLATKATNGRVTLWEQWGDHKSEENWIQVDLGKVEEISRLNVVNFWDNYRYYQFNVEGSVDGKDWTMLWDFSKNTEKASAQGYEYALKGSKARYLKLNVLFNSANPGLHVVEFSAW